MVTLSKDERWKIVDDIVSETVAFGKYKPKLSDVLGELTVKPLTGIPVAIGVLYAFWSIFCSFAGSLVTDGFMVKLFDNYFLPWIQNAWPNPDSILYFLFVGDPAADNCFEAFGVFTSGLFVAIGVVLPAIFIFYLMIVVLEDSGYMPRLAVLVDTVLHRIGLHGYAIVPTILGLGCNVPAITSTRILRTKKQRFMMMTMIALFVPCGAQLGVMQDVIPDYIGYVMLLLVIGYFVFGFIINRLLPGDNPEIVIDIPVYHFPKMKNVRKKLWTRTRGFIVNAIPFVLLGVLVVNVLYLCGVIGWLSQVLAPLFVTWFGVPAETVGPLIAAFLRKDLAVAQLSAIAMTPFQMVASVVLISIYFPCVATFVIMMKEGWKELLAAVCLLFIVVFVYGGIIHGMGILLGVA